MRWSTVKPVLIVEDGLYSCTNKTIKTVRLHLLSCAFTGGHPCV